MATNKADRAILFVWSCLLCVCVVWGGGGTLARILMVPLGGATLSIIHIWQGGYIHDDVSCTTKLT